MSELRAKHSGTVTLPANSGVTPGTTVTVLAADADVTKGTRTFMALFAIAAAGSTFTLVEIGVVGTATKEISLNANNPTQQIIFPEGLETAANTPVTARVMGNGGGVAVRCSIDYMRVIPA